MQSEETSAEFIIITGKRVRTSLPAPRWVRILFICERCISRAHGCYLRSTYGETHAQRHGIKVLSEERHGFVKRCSELSESEREIVAPWGWDSNGALRRATQAPVSWEWWQGKIQAVIVLPAKSGSWGWIRFSGFLGSPKAGKYLEWSKGNRTRDDNRVSCHLVVTSHLFNICVLFLSLY